VSVSRNENILSTESYNMGTVRLLQKLDGSKAAGRQAASHRQPLAVLVREYAEAARRRIDRDLGSARIDVCIALGSVEDGPAPAGLRSTHGHITLGELNKLIEKRSSACGACANACALDRADVIHTGGHRAAIDREAKCAAWPSPAWA
jgi:hypothetical protein